MKRVFVVGLGNIGSSICRALYVAGKYTVYGYDKNIDFRHISKQLGFCHTVFDDINEGAGKADIVILATPVSTYESLAKGFLSHMQQGAILSDVGSVKQAVIRDISPHIPQGVQFVPAHPIAGTEKSGPYAGFAELFENRYTIICPCETTSQSAIDTITNMWQDMGAMVEVMDATHHDKALAITSHIPHLLGFTLVGSARHIEDISQAEVIKYSAGGFRDATRVAGSDPTMWRDIFLTNTDSVKQVLSVFREDLDRIEKMMEQGDGDGLYAWFHKTREIRQGVIDAGQADQYDPTEDTDIPPLTPYTT